MNKMVLVFSLFSLSFLPAFASNDTTYGPTRVVPRAQQTAENRNSTAESPARKSGSSTSENKEFLESCICSNDSIKTLGGTGVAILLFPIKVLVCTTIYAIGMGFWESNKYLVKGDETIDEWYSRKIHSGASLGFGGMYLDRISIGLQGNANAELYLTINNHCTVRERMGFFGSIHSPLADIERDVYVNSQWAGVEHDAIQRYGNNAYTFFTEGLVAPFSENGAFYFTLGAGPVYQMEHVSYNRTTNFNSTNVFSTENENHWVQGFTFGIGRFASLGKIFGTYEIRYQGIINRYKREKPVPGDNTPLSHTMQLNWSLIF